jgi:thiamine kinase-like enzyme
MQNRLHDLIKTYLKIDPSEAEISYVSEGLTNDNYMVRCVNGDYIIRIAGPNSGELGIDRHNELEAIRMVSSIGYFPELIAFDPESGDMITRYIGCKPWPSSEGKNPELIARAINALKDIHKLPPVTKRFDPVADNYERLETMRAKGYPVDSLPFYEGSLKALDMAAQHELFRGAEQVFCHNDSFRPNYLFSERTYLLDWEYAGVGDGYFDLACTFMGCDGELLESVLSQYAGVVTKDVLRRFYLNKYLARMWCGTWALIQIGALSEENKYPFEEDAKRTFADLERHAEQLYGVLGD